MAEKKFPAKATSTKSKSTSKKTSTSKPKDPIKAVQKEVKKDIKKTAKKHPVLVAVIIIVVIAVICGVIALLYFNGFFDGPTYTGLRNIGGDKVSLKIGDPYEEKGVELVIKDKVVNPSEYTYTVEYFEKGPDGKFNTSDDIKVSTIDTSANNSYIAKYTVSYNNEAYTLTKKIGVGVDAMSITLMRLGNKYNGDSIYIKAGDTDILIDAGARKDSANTIYDYVTNHGCTDGKLEYVIVTHAHQDHIAGFVGSKDSPSLLERFEVGTLIQFAETNSTTQLYKDYQAKVENVKAKGTTVVTALDCWKNENGGQREYEVANGTTMKILYQKYYEEKNRESAGDNENLFSVVTLFEHGNNNYLLTGDLEEAAEESLVENNTLPEVEFFKAGHHGSATANNNVLLDAIKPKNIGISCVAGAPEFTKTNANTMPYQATTDRMSKYTDNIFCTMVGKNIDLDNKSWEAEPMNGNITFYSEFGEDYTFTGDNNNIKLKDSAWFKANRTWPNA